MSEPKVPTVALPETTPDAGRAEATAPEQPQQIGRYRVERLLGEGGFGRVYLAFDDQLHRQVAIKVPHRNRIARPEDVEAYLAEARILASLDHPHIVPVFDVGATEDGRCYVVSKLIEGSDLAKHIRPTRPSFIQAAALAAAIAEALHYAHRKGLVHRDVKPGNILIDAAGKPYVADFGLALKEEDFGKGAGFAGTPAYMSPEQARGEGHRVDGRSDIFSLGVVLYELLTGRRPFHGDSPAELLEQTAAVEARPPRQVDDAIPMELERICLKALAKQPTERYTTAKDMSDDLRRFLGRLAAGDEKARAKASSPTTPSARRRRFIWVGVTTAALAALAVTLIGLAASGSLFHRVTGPGPAPVEKSDLVDLFHVEWVGGGAGAILEDQALARGKGTKALFDDGGEELRGYSLAYIIDPDLDDVCDFTGTGCAFTFELQPRPRVPWVRVDGIDVVVDDYKALPKYDELLPGPQEEMNVYYAEIDRPDLAKKNTFTAGGYFEGGRKAGEGGDRKGRGRDDLAFVRLVEGKPEAFVVRVNAKTPGVYTFHSVVRLGYKDVESKQTIIRSEAFLFEGPRRRQPAKPRAGDSAAP